MMRRQKTPDESYAKYFYEKAALLTACKIKGTDAVSCLIGGIKNDVVKTGAKAGRHPTPASLFQYLSTLQHQPVVTPPSKASHAVSYRRRTDQQRNYPSRNGPRSIICFKCQGLGHKASECVRSGSSKRCGYCRCTGHVEADCTMIKRTTEEKVKRCPNLIRIERKETKSITKILR